MTENGPHLPALFGYRIVVTRAKHQAGKLRALFEAEGAKVIEIPTVYIEPPESWAEIDEAIAELDKYDWVLFASSNAVDSFLGRVKEKAGIEKLKAIKIAVIGKASGEALAKAGLNADFVPSRAIAESLIEEFPGYPKLAGLRCLWPRTDIGRQVIIDRFRAAGARIDVIDTYRTMLPWHAIAPAAAQLRNLIENGKVDAITVLSSQSAENLRIVLMQAFREKEGFNGTKAELPALLGKIAIIAIGVQTADSARKSLGKCDATAEETNLYGVVKATIKYFQSLETSPDRTH